MPPEIVQLFDHPLSIVVDTLVSQHGDCFVGCFDLRPAKIPRRIEFFPKVFISRHENVAAIVVVSPKHLAITEGTSPGFRVWPFQLFRRHSKSFSEVWPQKGDLGKERFMDQPFPIDHRFIGHNPFVPKADVPVLQW